MLSARVIFYNTFYYLQIDLGVAVYNAVFSQVKWYNGNSS